MRFTFPLAAFALVSALPLSARADVVTDWNQNTVDEIRKLALGPNPATRTLAISQIAVYEAVNAITHVHEPYHAALSPTLPVSPPAAAASAAYWSLLLQFPNEKATLDAELAVSLQAVPDGAAKQHGLDLGKAAAVDIYTLRLGDGSNATSTYAGSTDPGKWRPTPRPGGATPLPALEPWWRYVTPFALTKPEQFRPAAPPAISSAAFTTAYLETKKLGRIDSTDRTAEQTQIANFWKQATHVPFNAIARAISKAKELSLDDNARLFALLNITLADTRIAVWDAKYEYGFWRPVTAINTVTDYGNADAVPDETWAPLIETPNHPEYPSGHSITGGGGARLLATVFGSDAISFAVTSDTLPGVTRGFSKLSDAELENANSRIYGGLHYRFSNETGIALGHQVADYVAANYLKAIAPPSNGEGGAAGESGDAAGAPSSAGAVGTGGEAGEVAGAAGDLGEGGDSGAPTTGGTGGKGGSGGGAGKATVPPLSSEDDEDTSCAVSRPGGSRGAVGVAALIGVLGLAFARRRKAKR